MGRGSRKTHLCSHVSKRMGVVWTVPWLDGFIGQCSSLLVYDIPISLHEKIDTDLPDIHKNSFVERCPLSRRSLLPTKRISPSSWPAVVTQHWKGPLGSIPVSEMLEH